MFHIDIERAEGCHIPFSWTLYTVHSTLYSGSAVTTRVARASGTSMTMDTALTEAQDAIERLKN